MALLEDGKLAGPSLEACRHAVAVRDYLRERGAIDVYACATHALLSPPFGVKNMQAAKLRELIVTNTVYISPEKREALQPFLRVLSVADLLAEVIRRIHLGISVGEMFNE
jgi:ribose-phosphate pyrophosphokinase